MFNGLVWQIFGLVPEPNVITEFRMAQLEIFFVSHRNSGSVGIPFNIIK